MDYQNARHNMVEGQIKVNHVTQDNLIAAFETVPKEIFTPKEYSSVVYQDNHIPFGDGRFLYSPLLVARLLQCASIAKEDQVLVLGATTGYEVAIIGQISDTVVAIEPNYSLRKMAEENLNGLGLESIPLIEGDISAGYAEDAPWDVIVMLSVNEELPVNVINQLRYGGRLVTFMVQDGVAKVVKITKEQADFKVEFLFDGYLPEVKESEKQPTFTF